MRRNKKKITTNLHEEKGEINERSQGGCDIYRRVPTEVHQSMLGSDQKKRNEAGRQRHRKGAGISRIPMDKQGGAYGI